MFTDKPVTSICEPPAIAFEPKASVLVVETTCKTLPKLPSVFAKVTAPFANCDVPTEPALGVCKVIPLSAIIKSMLSDEVKAL